MDNQHPAFMVRLLAEMRIPYSLLELPVTVMNGFPDGGLRSTLFGSQTPFSETLPPEQTDKRIINVWFIQDAFSCCYIYGKDKQTGKLWLIGPYLNNDMSPADINRICRPFKLNGSEKEYLRDYYASVPKVRDANLLDAVVHAHCIESYGADGFEVQRWEMRFPVSFTEIKRTEEQPQPAQDYIEQRYSREQLMMQRIREGNYSGAVSAINRLSSFGAEARSTTLRDFKNYSIVLNTLCRVAAQQSGVHPVELNRCSRQYALQIENASDTGELQTIRDEILKEYCRLVRGKNTPNRSALIQAVIDFTAAGFSDNITLAGTARHFGVTPNYLSALFRRETGMTYNRYLNKLRTDYAKQLLKDTDLPISTVAAECGIPDSNYFARIFRASEGMTPMQYRRMP